MSTIIAFSGIHSETVILDCTQFHGCLCKANSCIFKCSPKVFYSLKPTPPHRDSKGTHYYIFIRVIIIIIIEKGIKRSGDGMELEIGLICALPNIHSLTYNLLSLI